MVKIIKRKTGNHFEETCNYARLVAVDNWIFVSNTAGRNPVTKLIDPDVTEQTLQVFANLEAALASVGSSLADVISTRLAIPDPAHCDAVMAIYSKKFAGVNPTLTSTSPRLASEIYKVEIELTAYRGAAQADVELINRPL